MKELRLNQKILLLQLTNFFLLIISFIYVTITVEYYWYVLSVLVWFIYCPIGCGLTLHRLLTHRSFEVNSWIENLLSIVSVFSTLGPTIAWVALHRIHHKKSDTQYDPHTSYINKKFSFKKASKVIIGYLEKTDNIQIKFVSDLLKKPIHRFIFNNYFKIILGYIIVLGFINPLLIIFAYAVPAFLTIIVVGLVNVLGHYHGYQTYNIDDFSSNSWIANIISFGEGWHNNHHANQTNSYTGEEWWEWDIIGNIIDIIRIDRGKTYGRKR